jgi:hypothetical protein
MLAHYMADMQDDPHAELLWDRRALEAAAAIAGEAAREYYPSLYLNLAEDYRKLGDWNAARVHLARAADLSWRAAAEWVWRHDPAGDCRGGGADVKEAKHPYWGRGAHGSNLALGSGFHGR